MQCRQRAHLVYVVSHDLAAPSCAITAYLSILGDEHRDEFSDPAREIFQQLESSSNQMDGLVQSLLERSRVGRRDTIGDVELQQVLHEVCQELDDEIRSAHAEIEIGELPTVRGSGQDLRLCFRHLLTNAIKFRQAGVAPTIRVFAERHGNYVRIAVEDNGIGIPEESRATIFGVFHRLHAHQEYPGLGIGLAHAQRVAELHGGQIWVEPRAGGGSVFWLEILEHVAHS